MPDWTSLRLTWEPRLLSILRVIVGLLFLEHGTAKLFDFPHQQTHAAYALFTLVPGLQGILELVGGALFAVGLLTRGRVRAGGQYGSRLFHGACAAQLF